jgi:hypothetical protein
MTEMNKSKQMRGSAWAVSRIALTLTILASCGVSAAARGADTVRESPKVNDVLRTIRNNRGIVVLVAGDQGGPSQALLRQLNGLYRPNRVQILVTYLPASALLEMLGSLGVTESTEIKVTPMSYVFYERGRYAGSVAGNALAKLDDIVTVLGGIRRRKTGPLPRQPQRDSGMIGTQSLAPDSAAVIR